MNRRRLKTELTLPQNDSDIDRILAEIGEADMLQRALQAEYDREAKKLARQYNPDLNRLNKKILVLATFVFNYVEQHKARLIAAADAKTVEFKAGYVKWKFNPPSVVFKNEQQLVRRLRKLKLSRFIRTKYSVKKDPLYEWLKEEANKIRGVRILREEELKLAAKNMTEDFVIKRSELPKLQLAA